MGTIVEGKLSWRKYILNYFIITQLINYSTFKDKQCQLNYFLQNSNTHNSINIISIHVLIDIVGITKLDV